MRLILNRTYNYPNGTIGELYINGKLFCDTLEPKDEGFDSETSLKVIQDLKADYKEQGLYLAIPSGTYQVVMAFSPKFQTNLPTLLNVHGYTGIRIHAGNFPNKDTQGCILVGSNGLDAPVVFNSRKTLKTLKTKITKAINNCEKVFITIMRV